MQRDAEGDAEGDPDSASEESDTHRGTDPEESDVRERASHNHGERARAMFKCSVALMTVVARMMLMVNRAARIEPHGMTSISTPRTVRTASRRRATCMSASANRAEKTDVCERESHERARIGRRRRLNPPVCVARISSQLSRASTHVGNGASVGQSLGTALLIDVLRSLSVSPALLVSGRGKVFRVSIIKET